ncbi:pyridoxal phosphate-dependent transferase [Vararia minispora EC-137]|uniref:Pyridoxal phosphate-dependent transferase n=1 Tax=Vararia minispora EC-137 TaxID=1314806 RepID=A0ACB8QVJ6_9AGAM|nr:pyridoxal phosphate-dependent transferase [Vararia minispora EC-137]
MNSSDLVNAPFRDEFIFPTNKDIGGKKVDGDARCVYLCGNSLGLLPKRAEALVQEEFRVWGSKAVEGHFDHPHGRDWMKIADHVTPLLAELVGAKTEEVACMGSLTANLHLMMNTFYQPTPGRYKILCEGKAFPSDQYAFASQAKLHGRDPKDAVLELFPRSGEHVLRKEDILKVIEEQGETIALVIFSGVQYYTGQWFPMEAVTRAAKAKGCICGWDLAHAVGNVPLFLHDWGVDWAVWCSYKYLNSGAGGIAGLFLHESWNDRIEPKYAGWWGHDPSTRFQMPPTFAPIQGAQGFQQSNPPILCVASLLGSLQIFKEAGMMPALRARSVNLTAYLESLLRRSPFFVPVEKVPQLYPVDAAADVGRNPGFTIITPSSPDARGAQLSLAFLPLGSGLMEKYYDELKTYGVIGDERKPDVLRLAPTALYNTSEDCDKAAMYLNKVMETIET